MNLIVIKKEIDSVGWTNVFDAVRNILHNFFENKREMRKYLFRASGEGSEAEQEKKEAVAIT